MIRSQRLLSVGCAALVACSAGRAEGVTVGLNPSNGVNMFVKTFSVSAGTTITGAQFTNNDDATVFPTVVLVRGGISSLAEGTTVRTASNVTETSAGVVVVTWSSPVSVTENGTYYVGICAPSGAGKQGPGDGPAVGATAVSSPSGSFIATGENGDLTPAGVNFEISLTTSGGPGKASGAPHVARTFLDEPKPNPFNPSTEIAFGVERESKVELTIFDVHGRVVRSLTEGIFQAGSYRQVWDGRDDVGQDSATGVYFVRLNVAEDVMQKKLVLVK